MTTITTDMLKALMDKLNDEADANNMDYDDCIAELPNIIQNFPWAKISPSGDHIVLDDGSVIQIVDMGDGSEYGWFWQP